MDIFSFDSDDFTGNFLLKKVVFFSIGMVSWLTTIFMGTTLIVSDIVKTIDIYLVVVLHLTGLLSFACFILMNWGDILKSLKKYKFLKK